MWGYIIFFVISLALAFLLRPRVPTPPPPTQDELDIPKVNEGDEIGRVYGSFWLTDPQVAWFGDEASEPITRSGGKKG